MKLLKTAAFAVACVTSLNSQAGIIQNGDFQTCDFSGWSKDTDGADDISIGIDFHIDVSGSTLYVNEVSLFEIPEQIPEPTTFALLPLGITGLVTRK